MALSSQGHVVFSGHNAEQHSVHAFSMSGRHLASTTAQHRLTGLLAEDCGLLCGDENGDLILRDQLTLQPLTSLPLQLPIQERVNNIHPIAKF